MIGLEHDLQRSRIAGAVLPLLVALPLHRARAGDERPISEVQRARSFRAELSGACFRKRGSVQSSAHS